MTGCAVNTDDLGADVYEASQLNYKQETKTVDILSIVPAKVAVDNTSKKEMAQTAGTILGAVIGAIAGYNVSGHTSTAGAVAGGAAGGTIGAASGGLVNDKVIVDAVSLTYKEGTNVYSSTQAGKACQFKPGTALVIMTKANETRIQPNSTCPTN